MSTRITDYVCDDLWGNWGWPVGELKASRHRVVRLLAVPAVPIALVVVIGSMFLGLLILTGNFLSQVWSGHE